MSISCLACNSPNASWCVISRRGSSTEHGFILPLASNHIFKERMKFLFSNRRNHVHPLSYGHVSKRTEKSKSSIYASFGGMAEESPSIFPRIHVKDPYQRLGISKEASVDEIQAARNFLVNKYSGHQPSIDAIESAHTKIIMQSFYDRKNPKIDLKKKVRDVTQSKVVKAVAGRFETPAMKVILKTAIAFIVLGVLTVLFPTEEGPTLQVAISLILSVYFIHDRLKSWIRAILYGLGSFFASWILGTFLMVSVIPPLLRGPRSLEFWPVQNMRFSVCYTSVAPAFVTWLEKGVIPPPLDNEISESVVDAHNILLSCFFMSGCNLPCNKNKVVIGQ